MNENDREVDHQDQAESEVKNVNATGIEIVNIAVDQDHVHHRVVNIPGIDRIHDQGLGRHHIGVIEFVISLAGPNLPNVLIVKGLKILSVVILIIKISTLMNSKSVWKELCKSDVKEWKNGVFNKK